MSRLLLIAGRRNVGKDTVAAILSCAYGAHVDAFAYGLKFFAVRAFGLNHASVYGASELRERVIPGSEVPSSSFWRCASNEVKGAEGLRWIRKLLRLSGPETPPVTEFVHALAIHDHLCVWFEGLRQWATSNHGMTVRHLLQQLGTDFCRPHFGADVWAVTGARRALRTISDNGLPLAVIVDGRFANEVASVRAQGGKVLHLVDPNGPPTSPAEHVSERDLDNVPPWDFDATLRNDKTLGLAHLERELHAVVELLFPDVKRIHKS